MKNTVRCKSRDGYEFLFLHNARRLFASSVRHTVFSMKALSKMTLHLLVLKKSLAMLSTSSWRIQAMDRDNTKTIHEAHSGGLPKRANDTYV